MALESLALFAEETYTRVMNLNVNVNGSGVDSDLVINNENRYTRHEIVVSKFRL